MAEWSLLDCLDKDVHVINADTQKHKRQNIDQTIRL
jgi:hypothetical protein